MSNISSCLRHCAVVYDTVCDSETGPRTLFILCVTSKIPSFIPFLYRFGIAYIGLIFLWIFIGQFAVTITNYFYVYNRSGWLKVI